MLSAKSERTVRIAAPLPLVSSELRDLAALMRLFPEHGERRVAPGGRYATIWETVTFGPLDFEVAAQLTPVETGDPRQVRFDVTCPALQMDLIGTFDLKVGDDDATVLRYQLAMTCQHPLLSSFESILPTQLDKHVHDTTDRIATTLERHATARRDLA